MAPPTNPRRNRRAWLNDRRECENCGHERRHHGGNIGRGRFGSSVYCVVRSTYMIYTGDWKYSLIRKPDEKLICGCRTFSPGKYPVGS